MPSSCEGRAVENVTPSSRPSAVSTSGSIARCGALSEAWVTSPFGLRVMSWRHYGRRYWNDCGGVLLPLTSRSDFGFA
jgi:hypothetical protein